MELIAFLLMLLAFIFLRYWWRRWSPTSGNPKNLPPGPPGWPLVGNLFQVILQRRHFFHIVHDLRQKYGPIFSIQMGRRTLIIVTSADLIHEALIQRGPLFASRPADSPLRLIFSVGKCTINSAEYGPLWRTLRRNMVSEMITPLRIKQCAWIRKWAVEAHMERIEAEARENGFVEVMINSKLTLCSILICLCFGANITINRIRRIESILKDVMIINQLPKLPDFFPVITPLFRRDVKEARKIRKTQVDLIAPLIRSRKAYVESKGEINENSEMVSPIGAAYVDSLFGLDVPTRGRLREEEMVTLVSEFIIGGYETSATAIEWAMFHLVTNQGIQEKLYGEIVDCVGKNGVLSESDVEKMPYLAAVVKETFRRNPPSHFVLPHAATTETELGGYRIPADANVEFYTVWLTEDPSTWENPEEFRPDRFVSGDGVDADMTGAKGVKMMPFGVGRRICPAWTLGMLHISLLLARMVQAFKWLPDPNFPPDPTITFAMTAAMKNPLKAVILPR